MAKSFNNKILIGVLLALVLVFVGVKYFGQRSAGGTFPEKVVDFDTLGIDRMLMNPKVEAGKSIGFVKSGEKWMVKQEGREITAANGLVSSMVTQIDNLKPLRLVTKNKDNWPEYDVTDSAGTRVRLYKGEEKIADIVIGRISYKQAPQTQMGMQGRGNVQGRSFVRNSDQEEVYSVEGFLGITFNRDFNSYRNQTFLRFQKDSVESIEFIYPLDSGFVLQKTDSIWAEGRIPVNAEAVNSFLSQISTKNLSKFRDGFRADMAPTFRLIITEKGKSPTTVQAFQLDSSLWILNSSYNPDAMFEEQNALLINQLFKGKSAF